MRQPVVIQGSFWVRIQHPMHNLPKKLPVVVLDAFTSYAALELYATAFESVGKLDKLAISPLVLVQTIMGCPTMMERSF